MSSSFRIATIKGIEIKIHWTFVFVLIWGANAFGWGGSLTGIGYGIGLTLLIFGIVLLHELGHSFVALAFHIKVQNITLFPLGGLARLERMPTKAWQELLVAAAGPAVNFVMAAALSPFVLVKLFSGQAAFFEWMFTPLRTPTFDGVLQYLLLVNVMLLVFNLLPVFPMDGGRIFRALLAMVFGMFYATRIAVWVGQGLAFVMAGYGIWSGDWVLAFFAVYFFFAGQSERQNVNIQHALKNIRVGDVVTGQNGVLLPSYTIGEVAGMALRSPQATFPVMRGDELLGILRRDTVQKALTNGQRWATVAEVMARDFPLIAADNSLDAVRTVLQTTGSKAGAVFEGTEFKGVIDFEGMTRAYRLKRSARQGWQLPS